MAFLTVWLLDRAGALCIDISWFSGHAGHECADHTLKHFPRHLQQALSSDISDLPTTIANAFITFDDSITNQVLSIFPDPEALASRPPEELNTIVNDQASGGANYDKIILSMRGTTALVALVDENRNELWVAGVGDCRAGECMRISTEHPCV